MGLFDRFRSWTRGAQPPAAAHEQITMARPEAGAIHAWGTGPAIEVAACTECLALRSTSGDEPGPWQTVGWHMISRGGWTAETGTLRWTLVGGDEGHVVLDNPGRIPAVFRERVQASIISEHPCPAPGGGQVIIAARRRLGATEQGIVWQVTTTGKALLSTPEVAEFAARKTAELRDGLES